MDMGREGELSGSGREGELSGNRKGRTTEWIWEGKEY